MKTNIKSLILITSILSGSVIAQESMDVKITTILPPTYYHQVGLAAGFSNANAGTVDLFGKNGTDIVSIPNNYVGTQEADKGDNYFGVITYYGTSSVSLKKAIETGLSDFSSDDVVNYGEYIQTSLPTSLVAGKEYEISFKVSLADNSGFATSGWGVYFSDKAVSENTNMRLTQTPQVTFTDMVKDKGAWTQLKAKFKATGNEKNMVIGCFNTNYKSENIGGGKGFAGNKAYYYVSTISFKEVASDRDKDGVLDKDDKCPDVFGLASLAGCPDADGDGITDAEDKCPSVKGLSKFMGCPDTDGDGITDAEDKCPTVAGVAENTGCPAVAAAVVVDQNPGLPIDKKSQEVFTQAMTGVQFESGKDVIKKSSYGILDNVATVLKENPSWKTTIEGHTDNAGKHEANVLLSQRRAEAVKKYLHAKGVTNELTPKGFGPSMPIADNKTPAGKAKNRRVQFKVTYMK